MYNDIVAFIKTLYPNENVVPLHVPIFQGNEKKYVEDCIDSTFVSSVGQYVSKFEEMICNYTQAKYAIATTNGTSALHMALMLVGVERDTDVISQALTFVATANAISYIGANPVFVDSGNENLGMCPVALESFLGEHAEIREFYSVNKKSGKRIAACVPMHVFGHPVNLKKIVEICKFYKIPVVEDAAESLGSFYEDRHTGLMGDVGILSFNGNKIVTCGGGGMIVTDNAEIAAKAKHLTTTAKLPHKWEFVHDQIGYNYRLPNLNAALACAQMEQIEIFVQNKRETASIYKEFFDKKNIEFLSEPQGSKSNYWLNAIVLSSKKERDEFLDYTNRNGVMTRPLWTLMTDLPAFSNSMKTDLFNARKHVDTIVNIPSSVRKIVR